jgi:uncharacterized protein (TIGR00251 family)
VIEYSVETDGCVIKVLVVPRASKNEVIGEHNGALKVRVTAPPVDGAANEQLIRVLSKYFDVSKSSVKIVGGSTARLKQIRVGCSEAELASAITKR